MLIHSVNVSCVCYNSYSFPTICRKEELLVTLYQLLLVASVTWSDVEDPQLQLPFPVPMRRFQSPLSWGVSGRMPTLTPGSWPFFSSTWPSESGPCSTGSLCLVVIGLWGTAACSNQLKPRGEKFVAEMLGCPMDPEGRKYRWPGTRNWEVRNQGVCTFSLGLLGLLSLASTDQLLASVCAQEEEAAPTQLWKTPQCECPAFQHQWTSSSVY